MLIDITYIYIRMHSYIYTQHGAYVNGNGLKAFLASNY